MFSFGIITDTHIRAPSGDTSSPYAVNDLANDRARYAVALLKAQAPEFVVHLGDMVHPLPEMSVYESACTEAKDIFKSLGENLHYVPGNHDVGDKPVLSGPAAIVTKPGLQKYQAQFGPSWKYFNYKNCCFIIINSSLINATLDDAQHQREWLESTFSNNAGQRFIVFSHYPLFVHDPEESEHYDNIANPGRQHLLELFWKHKVEIVFSGHVHHFFYANENDCAFYVLPATSFTRQDYAELFGISPASEFGRDDVGKYSVALVHIADDGHELQLISTEGKTLDKSAAASGIAQQKQIKTKRNGLTVSLRHAWHESRYLPYNGPMEEFGRKLARNDYDLLRLLQMGIQDVRVPIQDLTSGDSRKRIQDYHALGIRFHFFCLAELWPSAIPAVEKWTELVASIEYVISGKPETWSIAQLNLPSVCPVSISYASSGAQQTDSNKPFAHSVSTGFLWSERSQVFTLLRALPATHTVDSILFQIPWEADLPAIIEEMSSEFSTLPWNCHIYLRLANSNPALANFDDKEITERMQAAIQLAAGDTKLHLFVDTFMDIDRGYSPRHGLIDRLNNLRSIGHKLASSPPN